MSVATISQPNWRGFNLLEYFSTDPIWMRYFPYDLNGPFLRRDFEWIAEWGFNFARLPMDYRLWTDPNDLGRIDESKFEKIDQAIAWGRELGIHVSLNLHRAPGYCVIDTCPDHLGVVNRRETMNLFTDSEAQAAFRFQWEHFARRYRGISGEQLSFNLVNEPKAEKSDYYAQLVRDTVAAIRNVDPDRLVVIDGFPNGGWPLPELKDLNVVQSCRGYSPGELTHYQCEWADLPDEHVPTWPMTNGNGKAACGPEQLDDYYRKWNEVAQQGVPIHCGEMGCYKNTPYPVFIKWMSDLLDITASYNIGWGLWNLRGPVGLLDSNRKGCDSYVDWQGHQLDRQLLDLLQRH